MPASPGVTLWVGPDGGPFTVVSSSAPLPVTASYSSGNFAVVGPVNAGNPPSGGPAYVGGTDGTNVQGMKMDTAGRVAQMPAASNFRFPNLAAAVQSVKASAGVITNIQVISTQAAGGFVQIFNVASGSVTLGTTAPTMEIAFPAGGTTTAPVTAFVPLGPGVNFSTAISVASTTLEGGSVGSAAGVFLYLQYT